MSESVELRGHHLWCILTHSGDGYKPDFKRHMRENVIAKLNAGATVKIVNGPDAVCAGFSTRDKEAGGCTHAPSCVQDRLLRVADRRMILDVLWLLQRTLPYNGILALDGADISWLRRAFAEGIGRKHVCRSCRWRDACTEVSQHKNFEGALLMPEARPSNYPFSLSRPPRLAF